MSDDRVELHRGNAKVFIGPGESFDKYLAFEREQRVVDLKKEKLSAEEECVRLQKRVIGLQELIDFLSNEGVVK